MVNPKFSVIIPVYNRPNEVEELLQSLTEQNYTNFEVIIVEDGSSIPCRQIIENYSDRLNIQYHTKSNSGPGTTRNYGAQRAKGEVLIFFDSDCIIPPNYFEEVNAELLRLPVDAFGGPDKAHTSFTYTQKAINYSMTSFYTTGGIRGGKERLDKFYPRSFNMGISKAAFDATGGFSTMRFGEDVDFSLRIIRAGFKTRLFTDAFVYHKRRTDLKKFFRQVFNSGIARIDLHILHPGSLKLVHLLPTLFTLVMITAILFAIAFPVLIILPLFFSLVIFFDSLWQSISFKVALLSIPAAWVQLTGYGMGFLIAFWRRIVLRRKSFNAFEKTFYS